MKWTQIQTDFNVYDRELLQSLGVIEPAEDYNQWRIDHDGFCFEKVLNPTWKILKSAGFHFSISLIPMQKYPLMTAINPAVADYAEVNFHPTLRNLIQRSYLDISWAQDSGDSNAPKNARFHRAMKFANEGFYFDDAMKHFLEVLLSNGNKSVISAIVKEEKRQLARATRKAVEATQKAVKARARL